MENDKLTDKIIACCQKVHKELGPGFAERIYHSALKVALDDAKLDFAFDEDFSVLYNDIRVGSFKCDLYIEDKIMLDVNASAEPPAAAREQQLKAELKAAGKNTGLLTNFGAGEFSVKKITI
ncbi:MAG: GxxExxY protein [Bacteroidota bacterium]